jgi:small subunit ribosomal protein S2
MKQITLEELLEAGCHFGHQVTRSNPKARDFVFEARDNIQIIDLVKTKEGLDEAAEFVKNLGLRGGTLLVLGTKRQAKEIIEQEVARVKEVLKNDKKDPDSKLFYVTQRWIGGILTNFAEVSKNFKKLKDINEKLANDEEKAKYTKKEIGKWISEKQRLEVFYKGILELKGKPDALFIIDSHMEDLAVRESLSMHVETIGMVDTNADPYLIDHPIPANDDAVGSIKLIVTHILDAFAEGLKAQKIEKPAEVSKASGQTTVEAQAQKSETENIEPKTQKEGDKSLKNNKQKTPTKSKAATKPKTEKVESKKTAKKASKK